MTKTDPTLAEYGPIIEKLKPTIKSPDFDLVLNNVASDIPKPKRFLIKMELKRLSAPSSRRIDLRGMVDGECSEFEFNGIAHYLDDNSIERFQKGIETYGWYCTGVYEDIMQSVTNQKRQASANNSAQETQAMSTTEHGTISVYPASAIHFGERHLRSEERMNYSMQVEIEASLTDLFKAVTTDISVSGCRLKLQKKYPLQVGQLIYIKFLGLEKEFALGLKDKIQYKITNIEEKSGYIYPKCQRTYDLETHSFDEFLSNFINGNKRRYKLNLDNTVSAIINKGYEQYYLPRITSLPVFINQTDNNLLQASMMLTNDNNKKISGQWLDENNQNCLAQLLSHERLSALSQTNGTVKETIFYGFTHIAKGRVYFYSASIDELNENPELKRVFLAFGSSKKHWMVYRVQMIEVKPEQAHLPLTLPKPSKTDAKFTRDHKPPSPRVLSHISKIKYVLLMTELTTELAKEQYQNNKFELTEVNNLKIFGHSKTEKVPSIEEVAFRYVNLRSQTRYLYKTSVVLSTDFIDKQAYTKDFSISGMQIECGDSINVDRYEKIKIALPDLQQVSAKFKLKNLIYEVVGFNKAKTIVHLKAFEERGSVHTGKAFFEQLIDKNKNKLKAAFMGNVVPGLAEALRNIYVQSALNTAFFIHKRGIRHELKTIGHSSTPNPVINIFKSDHEAGYNLYPMLRNNYLSTFIINILRRLQRHSHPMHEDLLVRVKLSETNVVERFESILASEMRNDSARRIFIQKATQKNILFFALRIFISRTGRPDTDFIASELSYVSQYAIHKAKQLEEELWSVTGVGDIVDITEEVLTRYAFKQEIIDQQMQHRYAVLQNSLDN
ncbi:PilZ domain-containing protein [Catenovulum sediminis]|uniref:PilZ domain-containing protein n=1 Tax=Catenovulum sediminis TaxID=1740262 RepID=A0ABV1RMQ0_9ALTE|nr:PilZ domain-containing protein [Catenovulum sediminis]